MKETKNVNKNAVFNTIKSICSIIYPLITFPYISRVLMRENVGKIDFGASIISYFSLIASLGVTTYAVRECAKVREDRSELSNMASQIFSINLFSTLIAYLALGVTLIVAKPLENYRLLICIQSASILFTTLGTDWINTAMEDFRYITVRTVAVQCLSIVLLFLFIHRPEDYLKYAVISVIASSGAYLINIPYRRKFCDIRFTRNLNLKKHLPPIFLLFAMILSQTIYCNSDMTMLGLMKDASEVGLYSTSVKIYNLVNTVIASVAWVVMPQLSENFAKKNYDEINRLLKYSLNFIIVLGLPCLAGLNVVTGAIIEVIAGRDFLGAVTSLHILTIALLCSFIGGWMGNMIMIPSGRDSVCLRAGIVSALINIILNLVLIPRYGLNGAATTTAISEFLGICIQIPYMDKNIRVHGIWNTLKGPVLGVIAIGLIGTVCTSVFQSSFVILAAAVLASAVVYLLILILVKNEFVMAFLAPVLHRKK